MATLAATTTTKVPPTPKTNKVLGGVLIYKAIKPLIKSLFTIVLIVVKAD
ncbi:MAG: hypothetical protein Rsou_2074 [Candidatus Ruthia sp. Asou_11_S2]|nr:hypothetical protein [Candidatus Ruthia sp. Asou_11_S2]MBW5290792.1 hypothetical protein [Candidatus Ruthia sp. Asou_11_S2]